MARRGCGHQLEESYWLTYGVDTMTGMVVRRVKKLVAWLAALGIVGLLAAGLWALTTMV